ncbi:MAG: ribosomal protein S18-alanine N-acetyltransferase [Lachnospiraceae bacterium]|nr:ribosomal protein S18-alanine N-acetyltransferase [Lachnospiraceae bacterium]
MQIRPYKVEDLAQVVALDELCFHDFWSENNWKGTMGTDSYACFVLEEVDGKLAGFILISYLGDEGELLKICVAPDNRKKGLGSLLLDKAIESWQASGVQTVFLEVRESNVSARALYRKKGFAEIGIRKNYYDRPKEHAVIEQATFSL